MTTHNNQADKAAWDEWLSTLIFKYDMSDGLHETAFNCGAEYVRDTEVRELKNENDRLKNERK